MGMRNWPVLLAAMVLLGLPGAALGQAQADGLAALRASMSAQAHSDLTALVRDAQQRGLPTQPLVAKAQEGAAKNVPGERIVAAVRQTAESLGRAQGLLQAGGAASTDAEVTAVATALQRGVPAEAVSRLAVDARGRGSVGLSSHVLADLLGHGVPLALGLEIIGTWRSQGGDATRLNEIPGAVERLVRQGVVPARAGAAISAGLRVGRTPGSIMPVDVPRLLGG